MNTEYNNFEPDVGLQSSFFGTSESINGLQNVYQTGIDCLTFDLDSYSGLSQSYSHSHLGPSNHQHQMDVTSWTGEECERWASSVLKQNGIDALQVDLWEFRMLSGNDLLQFSSQDFRRVAGDHCGDLLYHAFQELRSHQSYSQEYAPLFQQTSPSEQSFADEGAATSLDWRLTEEEFRALSDYLPEEKRWPPEDNIGQEDSSGYHLPSDPLNGDMEGLQIQECFKQIKEESPETASVSSPQAEASLGLSNPDALKKIRSKNRNRQRGPKNWEFLMRLLVDKRTNPSLIRWEDEEKGTFRLMQPKIIAQMWGMRSADKANVSYNNFARGLRYHYGSGALEAVSERQLVYRWGPTGLEYLEELRKEST